jgi:hypothetical protein
MTHTPGPWVQREYGGDAWWLDTEIVAADSLAVAYTCSRHRRCANDDDAALIAAAPDLLAAAIEAMRIIMARDSQWDLGSDEYRAVADLAVAIKKATAL